MSKIQEITSLQNPLIKHIVKLRQNSLYRYEKKAVVVEGLKPILEICHKQKARILFTCSLEMLPNEVNAEQTIIVPQTLMQKLSGMVQSEGLLAEMAMPSESTLENVQSLLVLDSINDPGNLGTLLRTALALGWDGIFFVGDHCDPFNEKVLRACRGAIFTIPFKKGSWNELFQLANQQQLIPFVADLKGTSPETLSLTSHQKIMLVLSNEARGPSLEAKQFCHAITIPISSQMESLNVAVAGSILMYLLQRRMT